MPSFGFELKTLARLSLPAALSQLGMTAMGAIDTLLLGRVGVQELAAAALGNVWEWTWLCLGFGLVTGIEPMILRGMGRPDAGAALSLVGYYVIALPLGYVLCFVAGLGLPGLWSALAIGLVVLAVTLLLHVRRSARRPLVELQLDDGPDPGFARGDGVAGAAP